MQTFLPYPDFERSANVLDNKRLNSQVKESRQILSCLHYRKTGDLINPDTSKKRGWLNHPAVRMWVGYEQALAHYSNTMLLERLKRGQNDNRSFLLLYEDINKLKMPPWFGSSDLHCSHRSNLLRKDKWYYGQFGWKEQNNLPYVWPVIGDKV